MSQANVALAPVPSGSAGVRVLSHLLRMAAMALAAFALAWGLAATDALIAAMVGAALGVLLGQLLAGSRLKLGVVLGATGAVLAIGLLGTSVGLGTEAFPRAVGPAAALRLASVIRFGTVSLCVALALRSISARKRTATALELAFLVVAITTVFAAHRDGVIARPLWLADWAWQEGIDPAQILLGVGCVAVGLLAILLLSETRSGRSVSSLIVLAALATLALLCFSVIGVPKPDPLADLGIKVTGEGDPPPPPPPDAGNGDPQGNDGGGQPDASKDGGGQPDASDAGDGGGRDAQADGGGRDASDDGGGLSGDATIDDGGSGHDDGGADATPADQKPQQKQERPQESSQDQLDQSEGEQGTAAPVAVVILQDDYSPPGQAYYFREDALSQFNGTRLVQGSRGDVDLDVLSSHPTEPTPILDPPTANGRTKVHALVAMLTEHNRPFGLETPTLFTPAKNPNRQRFVRAYRFEALSQSVEYRKLFGKTGGKKEWKPDVLAYYTQAPSDPRYAELGKEIMKGVAESRRNDPFAKAVAVKLYLDHLLTYSTKARHSGAADPTAEMLFGDHIGYCVHFAHAAAFLWRTLGVPARVGVGYRTEEDQRKGGSTILVRGGDAHAWPELYLDGYGWIILDISAQKNLDPSQPPPDDDLQKLLGEMARNEPPDPETGQPPRPRPHLPGHFGRDLGIAGLLLIALAAAILYAVKLWRRLTPAVAGGPTLPRVGYRYALDLLGEAGLAREYGESREHFAARVKRVVPSFEKLTNMHLAARFRSPDLPLADRPELSRTAWKETLRAVRRELSAGAKRWRRLLGMLNPASFLDSK